MVDYRGRNPKTPPACVLLRRYLLPYCSTGTYEYLLDFLVLSGIWTYNILIRDPAPILVHVYYSSSTRVLQYTYNMCSEYVLYCNSTHTYSSTCTSDVRCLQHHQCGTLVVIWGDTCNSLAALRRSSDDATAAHGIDNSINHGR